VNSGTNFTTAGVQVGMIVKNTTDTTWSYVTNVAATELTLNDDIFISGEGYIVYSTPYLSDAFIECNGQVLSDANSPFNGATIPNLNSGTYRMLRGSTTSGTTAGSDTHNHQWGIEDHGTATHSIDLFYALGDTNGTYNSAGTAINMDLNTSTGCMKGDTYTSKVSGLPAYYEVVFVIRVK
jgi:hypothetical protein